MIRENGTGHTVPNQYVTPFRFSLVVSFDLITYTPLRQELIISCQHDISGVSFKINVACDRLTKRKVPTSFIRETCLAKLFSLGFDLSFSIWN